MNDENPRLEYRLQSAEACESLMSVKLNLPGWVHIQRGQHTMYIWV